MRRFGNIIKTALVLILSLACAALLLVLLHAPLFPGGRGYELYYGTSSAPVVQTDSPLLGKLKGGVTGESARFDGDIHEELASRFGARLLWVERVEGVVNYYLYSPLLGADGAPGIPGVPGVTIDGCTVNLHIAVGHGETVVGAPLIFGGV